MGNGTALRTFVEPENSVHAPEAEGYSLPPPPPPFLSHLQPCMFIRDLAQHGTLVIAWHTEWLLVSLTVHLNDPHHPLHRSSALPHITATRRWLSAQTSDSALLAFKFLP